MRTYKVWAAVVAGVALGACGGDDVECGNGTVEQDGICVPDPELQCPAGTVAMGDECVPDGSVICDQGTVFDPDLGKCVVDPSACAAGTVFVDGECVPFDDTLVGDVTAPAEPNDFDGTPGSFDVPAIGEPAETISGCIDPVDADGDGATDIDVDGFLFDVAGPTLLDVTIDGRGGLSAAFAVVPGDPQLQQHDWTRLGLDLTSDGARRRVYLPKAGSYGLGVTDSRSLFLDLPAGGPGACYFVQVAQLAVPAPADLPGSLAASGALSDDPQFYRYDGIGGATLQVAELLAPSAAARGAVVVDIAGAYATSAGADAAGAALPVLPGHDPGDDVVLVVDHVFDISLDAVAFDLTVQDLGVLAEPGDGTPVTITHDASAPAVQLYFFAAAGDLVRVEFDAAGTTWDILMFPPSLSAFIGDVCFACTTRDLWVQVQETGFHFFNVINQDAADGEVYQVAFTRTHVTPEVIAVGTPAAGSLAGADRGWYVLDAASGDWLTCSVAPEAGAGFTTGAVRFYDRTAMGQIDLPAGGFVAGVPALDADSGAFERIYGGDTSVFLVSVQDADGHDGDEQFTLDVADQSFGDLGAVAPGMPVVASGQSVGAGATALFLVRGPGGGTDVDVTVTGSGGFNAVLDVLDRTAAVASTHDATGAGGAETTTVSTLEPGFVAFAVRGAGGAGGSFDVAIDIP
jgi:hypothetical protein